MDTADVIRLELYSDRITASELKVELISVLTGSASACPTFEAAESDTLFRSIEPTVLVAIVGATGTAFGAFIAGVLSIARQREAKKIAIRGKDFSLEVPCDTSLEKIDALLERIKNIENPRIVL